MQRSPSIKTLIKDLEPDELREIILELSKLSQKNKQFLKLYLQSSDAVDFGDMYEGFYTSLESMSESFYKQIK